MSEFVVVYREHLLEPKYWAMTTTGEPVLIAPSILFKDKGYPVRENVKLAHYPTKEQAETIAFNLVVSLGMTKMIGKMEAMECDLSLCRHCRTGTP